MKKTILLLLLILITSGCYHQKNNQSYKKQILPPKQIEEQKELIKNDEKEDNFDFNIQEIKKEFSIIAKNWEFNPSQIIVNKNDIVKLKIKSIDVKHDISIPEFNISSDLNPNQETIIEFKADKTGVFTFYCSIYCGLGHDNMDGVLIVK